MVCVKCTFDLGGKLFVFAQCLVCHPRPDGLTDIPLTLTHLWDAWGEEVSWADPSLHTRSGQTPPAPLSMACSAVASTACPLTLPPAPSALWLTDHMVTQPQGHPPSNKWGSWGPGKQCDLRRVTEPVGGRAWFYSHHPSSSSLPLLWFASPRWVLIM